MGDKILKLAGAVAGVYFGGPGLLGSALGAGAGYATGSALTEKPPTTSIPAPAIEPVKTLPTPDDAATKLAKKRSIAGLQARKGRASTILTADTAISDALGG